jgi:hypothetical protein
VAGGFLGVVLSYPKVNDFGLVFAAMLLTAWAVYVLRSTPRRTARGPAAATA